MEEKSNTTVINEEQIVSEIEIPSEEIVKTEGKEKKKKIRKKILGYLIFLGVSALVIVTMILFEDRSNDAVSVKEAFKLIGENPWFAVIAVLSYFLIVLTDALCFFVLCRKNKTKLSFGVCCSGAFMSRYFDRVTPWSTGGLPFYVVYFRKKGLTTGDSCAVSMSRHIIRFFVVCIAVIIIIASSRIVTNLYVMITAIISVLGGLIVPTFMLIFALKPKIGQKISALSIKILMKTKLVKKPEKLQNSLNKNVERFSVGVRFLSANKGIIALIGACGLIELLLNNSVPFFVIRALGVESVGFWQTLVLCLFVNYASSFAPTPGGAGLAELSFYAIFAVHISGGLLFWAVLFWRIAVFYIPVLVGFILQVVTSVIEIVKIKKNIS